MRRTSPGYNATWTQRGEAKKKMNAEIEIHISRPPGLAAHVCRIWLDGHFYWEDIADTPRGALEKAAAWLTRRCRKCGCSLLEGCAPDCHWIQNDLCSNCK